MQDQQLIWIEDTLTIESIPSGSGLAVIKDTVFVVGDDSPWLFQLSPALEEVNRFLMVEGFQEEGRIPKPLKPDFECLAEFQKGGSTFLLAFGSGSKSPERDLVVKINLDRPEKPEKYSLLAFYDYLLTGTGESRENLNMEAALVADNKLYLFNRGTNTIFVMSLDGFLRYLKAPLEVEMPKFQHYPFKLPEVEGISAGFSGASALPGSSEILFTATLEATQNWIADGEIMGSYLGIIDLDRLAAGEVEKVEMVKNDRGEVLKDKLESVAVLKKNPDGSLKVLVVADNDDGTSKVMRLRIEEGFY